MKFKAKTLVGHDVKGLLTILKEDHGNVKAGHYISGPTGYPFSYQVQESTIKTLIKGKEYDMETVYKLPELIEALGSAVNGLEWRIEDDPTSCDESDYEKLEEWKELLNQLQ